MPVFLGLALSVPEPIPAPASCRPQRRPIFRDRAVCTFTVSKTSCARCPGGGRSYRKVKALSVMVHLLSTSSWVDRQLERRSKVRSRTRREAAQRPSLVLEQRRKIHLRRN